MANDHTQDSSPPGQTPSAPAGRRLRYWLLGGGAVFLCLLLTGLLLAGHYLSSPTVINRIQQAIAEQAGLEMEFQAIELDYFPRPTVVLQQVKITIPDYGQGKVAEISLSPAIMSLLVGDLRLGQLSLERPEFSLNLPAAKAQKSPASSSQDDGLETSLARGFAMFGQVSPDFELIINQGRLQIGHEQTLIETETLNLRLVLSMTDVNTASATLRSEAALLQIRRNGYKEALQGAELNGRLEMAGEKIRLTIKRLTLDEPGLEVNGKIEQASAKPSVAMDFSGKDIDVDATRRVALSLAGDVALVGEIFKYLRGGTVAQINVRSQGRTTAELGELENIRVEGRLLDGSVSIPEIELDLTETVGDVLVADGILQGSGMSTRLEGSNGHDGFLQVGLAEDQDLFQLELMLNADLAQAGQILRRIVVNPDFIEELHRITHLQGTGTGKLTLGDSLENIHAKVDVSDLNFSAEYDRVPFPIEVTGGQVEFAENLVNLRHWQGAIGDSQFTELSCQADLAGRDQGMSQGPRRIELGLDGTLEEDVVTWLSEAFEVPHGYAIRSPVKLSAAELDWQEGVKTTFKGGLSVNGGPDLVLDIDWQPDQLNIRHLKLKDQYSEAELSLDYGSNGVALNFSGALQHETLNALFLEQDFGKGRVQGDFSVKQHATKQADVLASGQLKGSNLALTLSSGDEVSIAQAALEADGDQVEVDLSTLSWRNLTMDPVKATLDFSGDTPRVRVAKANLCGLNAPGVWTIDGKSLALDVTLDGKALDVTTLSSCVDWEQVTMTGTLDLSGQITGQGQVDELIKALQGPLQANFANGKIQQGKILARTLEVLNVTEIVKGRLPNLSSEDFAYKEIMLQGKFDRGKLLISKIEMDGETLDVLGEGEIDLVEQTVNIELLAAPLQTVDTVVKSIPGVNYLLAGSLVAIPVSIKGPLDDPQVRVLSASSIGSSLLRLGERTIKAPLKLIETF
ncbi:MAG: AsmA-like C-terminal domain-containing protein, partial [Desulfuromonadales bacterium]